MLRPLVGAWVQVLFHSPRRGSFHRSLTVLCAIGLTGVFSLAGWSRRIRAGLHVSRVTQESALPSLGSYTGLSPSAMRLSRRFYSRPRCIVHGPTTPAVPGHRRFGLVPVRSPLLGDSLNYFLFLGVLRCFSSPGSPQYIAVLIATLQVAGLSHSEIPGS